MGVLDWTWRPPPSSITNNSGRRRQAIRRRRHGLTVAILPILALFAALTSLTGAVARSSHPPPLRSLHHLTSYKLEILPRHQLNPISRPRSLTPPSPHASTLRYSDTFLLSISLPSLLDFPAQMLLKPTEHLLHPNARVTHDNGVIEPLREEDWRVYTGEVLHPNWVERVKWEEMAGLRDGRTDRKALVGSARIMVHNPGSEREEPLFEGVFTVDGINYHVLSREHYERVKTAQDVDTEELGEMVVFRDSDMYNDPNDSLTPHTHTCSHDTLSYNSNLSHPIWRNRFADLFTPVNELDLFRRDDTGGMTGSSNYINNIDSTAGCPASQQIVYMGVALDCNYVSTYGSAEAARTQVLNNWNQVSALYKSTFNISLGIIELVVQNATCPTSAVAGEEWNVGCSNNISLDQRLSMFSQWRGNRSDDGAGLWHLMSACPTDSEVGVAWLGTLCQTGSNLQNGAYVSGTGISTATKTEWSLVAHEVGHGFGAIHDCTSGCSLTGICCPMTQSSCDAGGQYIMNPTTASTEQSFSACTLGNICSNLGSRSVSSSCVQSPSLRTVVSLQQCGNGIVEPGEECDPGSNTTSACCDASTCKFVSGAVCDPSNGPCCTSTCNYASAEVVCRPAVNTICDFPETCTGNNATCPADITAKDGKSCGSNGLACASGSCTSLSQQCLVGGNSNNLTTACGQKDDTSCVVSCKDPTTANQCIILQTPLVDGSPCGYGGHCYNQTCAAGSWQDTAGGWYKQNLQISIPVTAVAGILILAILFALVRCLWLCCARRGKSETVPWRKSMGQSHFTPATAPPRPPMVERHANSLSSQDAITRTSVIPRDSSPSEYDPENGQGDYLDKGAGYGYKQSLAPEHGWAPQHSDHRNAGHPGYDTRQSGYGGGRGSPEREGG